MPHLAEELGDLFRGIGEVGFSRAGLDAVRRDELVRTFRAFLHYLAVAGEIDPRPVWAQAVALESIIHMGFRSLVR